MDTPCNCKEKHNKLVPILGLVLLVLVILALLKYVFS
jgi:hypothetical protein